MGAPLGAVVRREFDRGVPPSSHLGTFHSDGIARGITDPSWIRCRSRSVSAIIHISRKSGSLPTLDPTPTARALRLVCTEWELSARGFVTPDLKESPAWTGYEMKILELGRALDFVIRKTGEWRGKGDVLDAAADVISDARYGRGRKSWIATIGEHGDGAYGVELAGTLADEEMAGYAIKALLRGGNGELRWPRSCAAGRAPGARG